MYTVKCQSKSINFVRTPKLCNHEPLHPATPYFSLHEAPACAWIWIDSDDWTTTLGCFASGEGMCAS